MSNIAKKRYYANCYICTIIVHMLSIVDFMASDLLNLSHWSSFHPFIYKPTNKFSTRLDIFAHAGVFNNKGEAYITAIWLCFAYQYNI